MLMKVRLQWQDMKGTDLLMTQERRQRRERGDNIHQRSTIIGRKSANTTVNARKRNGEAEAKVRAAVQRAAVLDTDDGSIHS